MLDTLAKIRERFRPMPVLDSRTAHEILGYDEDFVPR